MKLPLALAAVLLASPALAHEPAKMTMAQQGSMQGMDHSKMQGMNHGSMGMGMQMSPEMMRMHGGPAGPEFMAGMQKMHQDMMQQSMDADPTRSWAKMMIAHHQGAIDSSRTVLKHTQSAEARRLANKTIEENTKGQAELRALLARLGSGARR